MADFSVNSTQLSGPAGAGTAPLAPVQEQQITVDWMKPLSQIGDIFTAGIKNKAKADALAMQQSVVGGYVREQQILNDGAASGQIRPDVVATKSRALFGKYAAGSPQYIEDLFKAKNALSGGSELGAVEDSVKMDADRQKAREASARANGAIIAPWMDSKTIEQQLVTAEATAAAGAAFEQKRKIRSAQLSENAEDRTVRAIEDKKDAMSLMSTLADANLNSTGGVIQRLRDNIRNGSMTSEQGMLELEQSFSGINLAILKAGESNPELSNHFKSIFDGMLTVGRKALDPKTSIEDTDNEIKRIINVQKLSALQDPKIQKLVASNQLLGNNAVVALGSLAPITEFIAKATSFDSTAGEYVPQIVGNPDVEKDVLNFLKPAISKLNMGQYKDMGKAEKETVTAVNNVLKQTGDLMNDPSSKRDPKQFIDLAKFLSSPEYGTFAKSGKLNSEAASAAKFTWQSMYVPVVRNEIQGKLDEYLYGQANSKLSPKMVSEAISINFSGSGVTFTPLEGAKLDQVERVSQQDQIRTLKQSELALNQLIRIGTHLEGSTDYKSYWESNKHIFAPQLFSKYKDLAIGYKDPSSGKVYTGGDANVPGSWK